VFTCRHLDAWAHPLGQLQHIALIWAGVAETISAGLATRYRCFARIGPRCGNKFWRGIGPRTIRWVDRGVFRCCHADRRYSVCLAEQGHQRAWIFRPRIGTQLPGISI
jgi:hypothetical protein